MLSIKKLFNHCYFYIKKIIHYITSKIFKFNIINKYNLKKIQNNKLKNKECIFCFDDLRNENINYKCKYCSITFHKKCFKKYLRYIKYTNCIQCKR